MCKRAGWQNKEKSLKISYFPYTVVIKRRKKIPLVSRLGYDNSCGFDRWPPHNINTD